MKGIVEGIQRLVASLVIIAFTFVAIVPYFMSLAPSWENILMFFLFVIIVIIGVIYYIIHVQNQ